MTGDEKTAAPGVVGRKVKPTIEERIAGLEWKVEILGKAVLRINGGKVNCRDYDDCKRCPKSDECEDFDRSERD